MTLHCLIHNFLCTCACTHVNINPIIVSLLCGSLLFLYKFIYFILFYFILFIFGCIGSSLLRAGFLYLRRVGATLPCGAQPSHCGGFSCCETWALGARASVVVARGLQSPGSVVVSHGLSCSTACGIFPNQGSNPCPLHRQEDS